MNALLGKLLFLLLSSVMLGCSVTGNVQQENSIFEMVEHIDNQNTESVNEFRDSMKNIGAAAIPALLESYAYTSDFDTYYVIATIIPDIADSSIFSRIAKFYWTHEHSNAKVISIFTLMEMYHAIHSEQTVVVSQEILPVLIDAIKQTEVTFGKNGLAHVGNLSMLSAGVLELYAGDVLSDILHPETQGVVNIQERQQYLQAWYASSSDRLVWDDGKKQFVIR